MSKPRNRADDAARAPGALKLTRGAFVLVCATQVALGVGNTGMISVLPAIGRSLRIPDYQIAAVFALSAVLWFVTSPLWGGASDRHGRKPFILLGLAGYAVSCLAFALAISAGLHGLAAPLTLLVLFLLARGLFGLLGSATNPASQAYLADRTAPEERARAMAGLAGAFGLGTVIGPLLAPLLVLPPVGLAGPMYGFSLLGGIMGLAVWRGLTETARERRPAPPAPASRGAGRAPSIWRDERVRPFLIYAFCAAACQTGQIQTLGFLIIDRVGLAPETAQSHIAMAMMLGAVAGLAAQWGLLNMIRLSPQAMMAWGAALAAGGSLIIVAPGGFWTAAAGFAVSSFGFGLCRPGYAAASSLVADGADQARVAGAIAAVNGINALFAPAFVGLYGASHAAPFALIAVCMLAMLAYAIRQPMMRRPPVARVRI